MSLILRDCIGLPTRAEDLRRTFSGSVFVVSPVGLNVSGTIPVGIPEEWLPQHGDDRRAREWFAADTLGLAAVQTLDVNDDFVWFMESDVWAPDRIWRQIFESTAESDADGIFAKLMPRWHPFSGSVLTWNLPGNPVWVTHTHIFALYRLSRRAISWCIESAVELRECYSEQKTASVIYRKGGTVADLREFVRYSSPRSFVARQELHRFDAAVANHPVKNDIGTG